jgi:hypothetical protein
MSVMTKSIAFALLAIVLVSGWLGYSKITQARREATYRSAIAPFQRDLRVGMGKTAVQKYLDSRRVSYRAVGFAGNDADTYEIKIGEEPGSFVCDPWNVYIALEFSPTDKLREVHIKKIGTCL